MKKNFMDLAIDFLMSLIVGVSMSLCFLWFFWVGLFNPTPVRTVVVTLLTIITLVVSYMGIEAVAKYRRFTRELEVLRQERTAERLAHAQEELAKRKLNTFRVFLATDFKKSV